METVANLVQSSAATILNNIKNILGITNRILLNCKLVWLSSTYEETYQMIGVDEKYRELGNYDPDVCESDFKEEGRLFDLIFLAINHKNDSDGYYWVLFEYYQDKVLLRTDATSLHSKYCEEFLYELTGFKENVAITHEEANSLLKTLYLKKKSNKNCFKKLWEEYCF